MVSKLKRLFRSNTTQNNWGIFDIFNTDRNLSIIINGLTVGSGFITAIQENIKGIFNSKAILGDKSIALNKIKFCVPNLREFNGNQVVEEKKGKILYSNSRLEFENEDFKILLDKRDNYSNLKKELKNKGGYLIQYDGELERVNKKNISHQVL